MVGSKENYKFNLGIKGLLRSLIKKFPGLNVNKYMYLTETEQIQKGINCFHSQDLINNSPYYLPKNSYAFREFGFGSTNNLLIDIFHYSH